MEDDPKIREARESDVIAIVRLIAADQLGATREDPTEPLSEDYRQAFAAIESDPLHELIVMESNGQIIGTLQLSFLPGLSREGAWRAQIEAVRIAAERRGRGLGARLIRWAIERARAHGCRLVQLTTDKRRARAKSFYETLGFEASHEGMKLHIS